MAWRLLLLAALAAASPASLFDYDVEVSQPGTLGLKLDEHLVVRGFGPGPGRKPGEVELSGMCQVGDALVGVNGESLEGATFDAAVQKLREASSPRSLLFRPFDAQPRVPLMILEQDPDSMGHVDVFMGPLSEHTLDASIAVFSGPAPCAAKKLVWVDSTACVPLSSNVNGSYVAVRRGGCEFFAKAVLLERQGAAGMLVVNTEDRDWTFAMPMSEAERADTRLPSVMVSKPAFNEVLAAQRLSPRALTAKLVLSGDCHDEHQHSSLTADAEETRREEEAALEALAAAEAAAARVPAGRLALLDGTAVMEFIAAADFGGSLRHGEELTIVRADPADACAPLHGAGSSVRGAALLVSRGRCSYVTKALHAAQAGAVALVVANDMPGILPMRAGPGEAEAAATLQLPALMVAPQSGKRLQRAFEGGARAVVAAVEAAPEILQGWADLTRLLDDYREWPRQAAARKKVYYRLSRKHHPDKPTGSQERFNALFMAYSLANFRHDGVGTLEEIYAL